MLVGPGVPVDVGCGMVGVVVGVAVGVTVAVAVGVTLFMGVGVTPGQYSLTFAKHWGHSGCTVPDSVALALDTTLAASAITIKVSVNPVVSNCAKAARESVP